VGTNSIAKSEPRDNPEQHMVSRLLLASTLILLATGPVAAADSPRRPNIIFILADDLGWGDLHCYGSRDAKTPNLDRLAAQGTLFTQFYTAGSMCSPSRCGFFTGEGKRQDRDEADAGARRLPDSV
jgi:hypothetical protein